MNQELLKYYNRLDVQKDILVGLLKNFSAKDLNHIPEEGKWSAAQIAAHLILGEEFSVAYLKIKLHKRDKLKRAGIGEWFRSKVLNIALRSRFKFKAPEFTTRVPAYLSQEDILARWLNCRNDLREILETFPPDLLDQTVFRHPVAGRISIFQALSFMESHIIHHLPQVKARFIRVKEVKHP